MCLLMGSEKPGSQDLIPLSYSRYMTLWLDYVTKIVIKVQTTQVHFVSESGIDTGGPSREFWRLFVEGVASSYCIGNDHQQFFFNKNVPALQVKPCIYLSYCVALILFSMQFLIVTVV